MIGQMQGKFQLSIVQDTGHAIQEDQPAKLASILHGFIKRHMEIIAVNEAYQRRQSTNGIQ